MSYQMFLWLHILTLWWLFLLIFELKFLGLKSIFIQSVSYWLRISLCLISSSWLRLDCLLSFFTLWQSIPYIIIRVLFIIWLSSTLNLRWGLCYYLLRRHITRRWPKIWSNLLTFITNSWLEGALLQFQLLIV
jgi:hypothetical protein